MKDPICGMTVDEVTALRAERDGQEFYFFSEHCRKRFLPTPDRVIGQAIEGNQIDCMPNVRSKFTKLVCAAVLACGFFFAGCATRPVVNGVPNFAEVEAGLYRGGQPNEQGWQFLRSLGVTNVVKLNREVADTPADGMNVYSIPLPPANIWEAFQKPCSNDVWRAVQAMKIGRTYVHCYHGRDRVGLVVGCYRMWIDGWSESAAAREMSTMGYRWSIPGLAAFWKSVTSIKREDENKHH